MTTYSNKPNAIVTSNGIMSACLNDCTYTFITNVPEIIGLSLSSNLLTIELSNPASINVSVLAFTVIFDDQPCTVLNGTIESFICALPQNTDGTPIITAGSNIPSVFIPKIGYIMP